MKSNHTSEPEYTAQEIMQILANAIGCGIAILGTAALLEGYENEDEEQKRHGLDMVQQYCGAGAGFSSAWTPGFGRFGSVSLKQSFAPSVLCGRGKKGGKNRWTISKNK